MSPRPSGAINVMYTQKDAQLVLLYTRNPPLVVLSSQRSRMNMKSGLVTSSNLMRHSSGLAAAFPHLIVYGYQNGAWGAFCETVISCCDLVGIKEHGLRISRLAQRTVRH